MPDRSPRRDEPTLEVKETPLPGVGVRYDIETSSGERVSVLHYRSGRRRLFLYESDDPDCILGEVNLDETESQTLAELFGGPRVTEGLDSLQQIVEGLAIDWLTINEGSPYVGRTIGDTRARSRTGSSIVAILRKDHPIPAPGPEMKLESGDTLVVVGTSRGVEDLAVLLRIG